MSSECRGVLILLMIGALGAARLDAQEEISKPQTAEADSSELRSPRATMRTFLVAADAGDFDRAAATLDMSELAVRPTADQRQELVRRLKGVIDRLAWVDYAQISDSPDAATYHFPPDAADPPIAIAKGPDGAWRFSGQTVVDIDGLFEKYRDRPLVVKDNPWYRRTIMLGNESWRIIGLFLAVLAALIVGKVAKFIFNRLGDRFEKKHRRLTATLCRALGRSATFLVFAFGLKLGLELLILNVTVEGIVDTVMAILITIAFGFMAWCLVEVVSRWLTLMSEKTESKLDDMLVPMVRSSLRVTVVIMVMVQIATILSDKPVTSIIAGLGVGGLAIGLAAQDTIKNFFGSIMLFSDQPFEVGDRIVVGDTDGPVESVGFRSTRIRTLEGHLVTIPNGDLANQAIRNVGKRPNIRRMMNLGLTYDTSPEKVARAKEIVEELLANHEGMDSDLPPRVYFNEFQAASLNLFVIYWYHPPDWWAYCDFSEQLNMEILRRFNAEGIEFAFPTQTIYVKNEENTA